MGGVVVGMEEVESGFEEGSGEGGGFRGGGGLEVEGAEGEG